MKDPFTDVGMGARYFALGTAAVIGLLVFIGVTNVALLGAIGVLFFFFVVMIGFHELGHFVMARRAGMKVSEFFIGFGPRLWSTRRGETEYGVKALPLGGYCKIVGMTNLEEIEESDEPRAFRNATFWGKASTLVAGPASHFLLALVLVWSVLAFDGVQRPIPTVAVVERHSAADAAGLKVGDRVLDIAGKPVKSWSDLQHLVRPRADERVAIVVERNGARHTLQAQLGTRNGLGFLGVSPRGERERYSPVAAAYHAPGKTYDVASEAVAALGTMFSPSGISHYLDNFTSSSNSGSSGKGSPTTAAPNNDRFVSPVGVGRIAYDAAEHGWVFVFGLLISINVFVGLINLVPLIPFDGGHLAIAAYEAIASRIRHRRVRADYAKLMPIAVATISVLAFIFLSSLFLDVTKPPAVPF